MYPEERIRNHDLEQTAYRQVPYGIHLFSHTLKHACRCLFHRKRDDADRHEHQDRRRIDAFIEPFEIQEFEYRLRQYHHAYHARECHDRRRPESEFHCLDQAFRIPYRMTSRYGRYQAYRDSLGHKLRECNKRRAESAEKPIEILGLIHSPADALKDSHCHTRIYHVHYRHY